MSNLIFRVITAALLLPLVITVLFVGGNYLAFLLGLISLTASLESANIISPNSNSGKLIAITNFFCWFICSLFIEQYFAVIILLFISFLTYHLVILFNKNIKAHDYEKLSLIFLWSCYITLGTMSAYWLTSFNHIIDARVGVSFVLLACVATWTNDTFAYFGGKAFGKRALFKRISQKKTWEGFICGSLMSITLVIALKFIPLSFGVDILFGLNFYDLLWVTIPAIALAPLGDLFESRLKRFYNAKDASNILPGHGGILDRIDGILTVMPWTALYAFIIRVLY